MNRFLFLLFLTICSISKPTLGQTNNTKVIVGAENLQEYLPLLKNKRVALVVNHTSMVKDKHLVDLLLEKKIKITAIYAPEHGFRGEASAGDHINDSLDKKTGLKIYSLHGKNKKPTVEQLKNIDIVVFDIQDVGARFYTYISTLHYLIEACGENNKKLIVLDRPNPNGHYVAGPVLDLKYKSFVGMNCIPIVHGLTVGEYAKMNIGEKWTNAANCDLTVIKCKNYSHQTKYILPLKPSPNLPNNTAIWIYPSICIMEPTQISVGRGTDTQFQVIGGPDKNLGSYTFTPEDMPGAINPVDEGKLCYGESFGGQDTYKIPFTLDYILKYYKNFSDKEHFFTSKKFFNNLIGNSWVLEDIEKGLSATEIENKWQPELEKYKTIRKKYLIYAE